MKQALFLLALLSFNALCHAQPDPNNPVKATNPPAALTPSEAGRQAAEKFATLSPAQQKEFRLSLQEKLFRGSMTQYGFKDVELQDKLWKFQIEQYNAGNPVRVQAARLNRALFNTKVGPDATTSLLHECQDAVEAERARYSKAVEQLRVDLNLDEQPRLEAFLQLYGLLGDTIEFLGLPFSNAYPALELPRTEDPGAAAK